MKILGDYERVAVRWEGPYNEAKDDAQCYCGKCDLPLEEDDWNFCPKCGVGLLRYDYEQRYRRFADIGMTIELAFDQRDAKYLEIRDKDENLILFAENTQDLVDWIDEKHIAELVSQDIARRIVADTGYIGREAKYGVREAMDKGVRDYIYKEKESIIEREIPKMPFIKNIDIVCPACGGIVGEYTDEDGNGVYDVFSAFCPECGQALQDTPDMEV